MLTLSRRTILTAAAALPFARLTGFAAPPAVYLYIPHPDDESLSMSTAALFYLFLGYDVHFVFMSPGTATQEHFKLSDGYNCPFHGYVHNCAQEQYPADLTIDDIGAIRLKEGASAAGAMGTITGAGRVFVHVAQGLEALYWGGTDWQNPDNVDVAKNIIKGFVDQADSSTFHHAISDRDRSADHACIGRAMRELTTDPAYAAKLSGTRFFISRLYWSATAYPDIAAKPGYSWVSTSMKAGRTAAEYTAMKAEIDAILRNRVGPMYTAWNPAALALAIGGHSVYNQFQSNGLVPGSTVAIDNKWHL